MNTPDKAAVAAADVVDGLEISLASAIELCNLGLGTLVDIRQAFEIELKGAIPGTVHIPLFEVKVLLGHTLSEDEQDILDAGKPTEIDVQGFFTTLNRVHHVHDKSWYCGLLISLRNFIALALLGAPFGMA